MGVAAVRTTQPDTTGDKDAAASSATDHTTAGFHVTPTLPDTIFIGSALSGRDVPCQSMDMLVSDHERTERS